ncbi:sugar epimerase [Virgibacillus indicus]|uniref:Sugar epimerase n=1 Tax=Virgibacillus indicus TaxID=2024554 RepID=A0A265NBE9_9BACI|nr:SDR family oxidoreductase [Virgibacillus indicus]OZU89362.1 sugar epimerase [Virgibacillus indicus]
MKTLVIGANGQIGRHVVDLLKNSSEHTVTAMVRKKEQAKKFNEQGVDTALVNLEDSVDEIAKAAKGFDAVVFTAGSGGSTGPDKTLVIDLDGAIKSVEAAEQAGVKRFVIVSAIGANNREKWGDEIKHYYAAKHYADKALEASNLNYTIVRPGGLLNEEGTGKVNAAAEVERGSIPRVDVAKIIVASLDEENTFNKGFDLISGDTPIEDAVKNV